MRVVSTLSLNGHLQGFNGSQSTKQTDAGDLSGVAQITSPFTVARGQHAVSTRSAHGQHTVSTRSAHGQHAISMH